jgi:hypothetical protein
VYGKGSIHKNGLHQMLLNEFEKNDISVVPFSGIQPNPLVSDIENAIELGRNEDVDAVVAVGGGSVIDSAKAISAGFFSKEKIWDTIAQQKKIKNTLPIYTVLTISGTASEMNGTAVISNKDTKEKRSLKGIRLYPKATWIDPYYQNTVSNLQLSYTAMDIISHVFEYYFAGYKADFMDCISESIIKTVMNTVSVLQKDPFNEDARGDFAWAATWALNGFTACGRGKGDFASHRIGHAISAMFSIPHGQTLAVVQPAWMRYCFENDVEKFERFGKEIFHLDGKPTIVASDGIHYFMDWIHTQLQLSTSLCDLGIRAEEVELIAKNNSISYPLGTLRELNQNDVMHILRLSNY